MEATSTITETNTIIMNKPEPYQKTGLGERLKSAREALHLSEKEAATRLHLNSNIITLLENENFVDGPPATFMRGYLRTYARLLNLPENEIVLTLKELENSIPSSVTTAPAIQMKAPIDNERYLHWLTYVIVLVLLVLVSVWWSSHSRYMIADVPPAHTTTTVANALTPNEIANEPTTAPVTTATQPTIPQPQTITPVTTAPTVTPAVATTAPAMAAPIPPTTVAPATTDAAATTPAKPSTLSKFKMALPEPDVDN